jgi:RecB family endonuclease NucS
VNDLVVEYARFDRAARSRHAANRPASFRCRCRPLRASRYLDLMRRDTLLGTVHGILAAQLIKPQARVLASDRGISCVTVDYDMLRGLDSAEDRLF